MTGDGSLQYAYNAQMAHAPDAATALVETGERPFAE